MMTADVATNSLALIRSILEDGGHGTAVRCGRRRVFVSNQEGIVIYGLYNDGIYVTLTHDADEAYEFLIRG